MRDALQLIASALGLYLAALGFLALWFAQCTAQGRDPWISGHDR